MPKVSPSAISSTNHPASSNTGPNSLKRNQACHQCRRRKLKWYFTFTGREGIYLNPISSDSDAKRPCSTCVRSHAHAKAHSPPGTHFDSQPDCTFDEVVENTTGVKETPKDRYERLESRINELEALLSQKEASGSAASPSSSSPSDLSTRPTQISTPDSPLRFPTPPSFTRTTSQPLSAIIYGHMPPTDLSDFQIATEVASILDLPNNKIPQQTHPLTPTSKTGCEARTTNNTVLFDESISTFGLDIIWPNWPPNLPNLEILRHLVDVFFIFHPHATRLLHQPTFLSTLLLPPLHPDFPATSLLHAICAMGSFYTSAVSSPPMPSFVDLDAEEEIFSERRRLKDQRPDSFAELHAKLAKKSADYAEGLGDKLLQLFQTRIILSWYYWSHSKWVEVFLSSAHSLRVSVPLGLNVCITFHSIATSQTPPSLLHPTQDVVEEEMRRNAFWLAYATDRQHSVGNHWALSLDDQDISQVLPGPGMYLEHGIAVDVHERQWAHSKDLLLIHPEKSTDSFSLYIKGTILLSRVKTFNLRFRSTHFAGLSSPGAASTVIHTPEFVDPRSSPAFIEVDQIVSSFRNSFPTRFKSPITDGIVDSHLFTTCLVPHMASILLHEPHARVGKASCVSACKILLGARAILDLIYSVWSTSFDITLLDTFCLSTFYISGRVLVRFLQAALDVNIFDQVSVLKAELEFLVLSMSKISERIPLAFRYVKMLNNLILNCCGSLSGISDAPLSPQENRREAERNDFGNLIHT